jgi:uncharacterized protein (DUF1684 family)
MNSGEAFAIVCALLCAIVGGCSPSDASNEATPYNAVAVQEFRQTKDELFREDGVSPIPHEGRAAFGGLRYFPINERYCVQAAFEAMPPTDTLMLATTHGDDVRRAVKAGVLRFRLDDIDHQLAAYQFLPLDAGHYFLAFSDKTSGVETYHGGRYLEMSALSQSGTIRLDFNLAYNPYCAYNGDYSCPLVPIENRLAIPIRAGERTWK